MPLYNRVRDIQTSGMSGLDIFGPSSKFKFAQRIRDEYNAMADNLRDTVDSMPVFLQGLVRMYLPRTRAVIARGAVESDKQEIIAKIAEWDALLVAQMAVERAAVSRVVAEQQAEALRDRARIVQRTEASAELAATEAQARASEAETAVRAAAAAIPGETLPSGVTAPDVQPLKAGLFDNPVLIAVAVGALIFLLKK